MKQFNLKKYLARFKQKIVTRKGYQSAPPSHLETPLTFKITTPGIINWRATDSSVSKTIEYKLNNGEWISIKATTAGVKIIVNAGDKIQFRGNNTTYSDDDYKPYNTFSGSTAGFEIEGNIMSLINSTDFITATTLENTNTFYGLFMACTGLTSAENLVLPATILTNSCYGNMFFSCTSLITAPSLPATTLAMGCYSDMFAGCTSLITAPSLPATALASFCYQYMFYNCTSLTTAPFILPATVLENSCYDSMFANCKSLTTAPELPATTFEYYCYENMFNGCTKLNYIKCLATDISADWCTINWVNGVASTGTFVKAPNMSGWNRGENDIPTGWTIIDAA